MLPNFNVTTIKQCLGGIGLVSLFFICAPSMAQAIALPSLQNNDYNTAIKLTDHQSVGQSFVSPTDSFGSLEVRLTTYRKKNSGHVLFRIKEYGSETWLYENTYAVSDFYNQYYYPFGFPIIRGAKGKTYYVELTPTPTLSGEVGVMVSTQNPLAEGTLFVDQVPQATQDMSLTVVKTASVGEFVEAVHMQVSTKVIQQQFFFLFYALLIVGIVVCLGLTLLVKATPPSKRL